MKRLSFIVFCILVVFQTILFAQTRQTDSLKHVVKTLKEDSNKVNILNFLAEQFRNNKPDTSIYLAQQALAICEKIDFKKGISEAHLWIGTAITNLGKYDEALSNLNTALAMSVSKKT